MADIDRASGADTLSGTSHDDTINGLGGSDATGRLVIDLTELDPADGFIIQGDAAGDSLGFSVSSAGDVNGDGIDDIIVGAPRGNDGGAEAGEAYVVFGSRAGFGVPVGGRQVLDLTSLTAAQGFIIRGDVENDFLGHSVSSAGDINGDGNIDYRDLLLTGTTSDDVRVGDGDPLPQISPAFLDHFGALASLDWSDLGAVTGFLLESERLCAGTAFAFDEEREKARVARVLSRTDSPASMFNHAALTTRHDMP